MLKVFSLVSEAKSGAIQFGPTSNEAPGGPAPAMEAELRRLQEEVARLNR